MTYMYVADLGNNNIQKFDSNVGFITKLNTLGNQFGNSPGAIAVDTSNNLYAAEYYTNSIQKFDNNGKFITKWGSQGSGDGQFSYPSQVTVDSSGNVHVDDSNNNRIQVFAPS